MEDKNIQAYRLAYETANKKPLEIRFSEDGQTFFVEDMPYKMAKMTWMTDNLNNRIVRQTKLNKENHND